MSPAPLHAVVLAGGPGLRIPPYSTRFPKPLVPLGEHHAVIEVVLRQLAAQGFAQVSIAVGHLGELVRAYCGDGSRWGIPIDYWVEPEPLGTVGPIVAHREQLPEHVLVMNGDVLTDLDYAGLLRDHAASDATLSVATARRATTTDFGVLDADDDDRIVAFWEKPTRQVTVSTGIYALSSHALGGYRPGVPIGFDRLVLDLIAAGDHPRSVPFDGFWLDLGRPEEYDEANSRWPELAPGLLPGA